MLDPVINFFEKLISEFTWRRLFFIAVVFMIAAVALWTYESYTSHFIIRRIEKSAELVEKLAALSANPLVSEDEELRSAYVGLKSQLDELVNSNKETVSIKPWIKRGLFAALPWLLLCIILTMATSAGEGNTRSTLFGVSIVAVPIVAVLTVLPTYESTWINDWAVPWATLIIVMTIIMVIWGPKGKKNKRDEQLETQGNDIII